MTEAGLFSKVARPTKIPCTPRASYDNFAVQDEHKPSILLQKVGSEIDWVSTCAGLQTETF